MKQIPLTKGKSTLVDDEDFLRFGEFLWIAQSAGDGRYYAARREKNRILLLHREILSAPEVLLVDHRDRDSLNNQRDNLRFASKSQNAANSTKTPNLSSRFKGVCHVPRVNKTNPWLAYIGKGQKRRYLKYHSTEELAAEAYNRAARETFGEFALLNQL